MRLKTSYENEQRALKKEMGGFEQTIGTLEELKRTLCGMKADNETV